MSFVRTTRIAVLASSFVALSGCHIGNYEQDQPGPGAPQGYYETTPTSMEMCTTLPSGSGSVTNCQAEATTHMDSSIAYVFSDPVDLTYNSGSGTYQFSPNPVAQPNPDGLSIPTLAESGDVQLPPSSFAPFSPMSSHPGCQVTLSIAENGTYSSSGPFNSGTALPLKGRIAMTLNWAYGVANASGSNDCAQLPSCYAGTGCTSDDQMQVIALFGNFVATNLLTQAQLSTVTQLQYVVSFQ